MKIAVFILFFCMMAPCCLYADEGRLEENRFEVGLFREGMTARLFVSRKSIPQTGGQAAFQVDPVLEKEKTVDGIAAAVDFVLVGPKAPSPIQSATGMSTSPSTRIVLTYDKASGDAKGMGTTLLFGNTSEESKMFGLYFFSAATCANLASVRYRSYENWPYFSTNLKRLNGRDITYEVDCDKPAAGYLGYSSFPDRKDFYQWYMTCIDRDVSRSLAEPAVVQALLMGRTVSQVMQFTYEDRLRFAYDAIRRYKLAFGAERYYLPRSLKGIVLDKISLNQAPAIRAPREYDVLALAWARLLNLDLELMPFNSEVSNIVRTNFPVPLFANSLIVVDTKTHKYLPFLLGLQSVEEWRASGTTRYGEIVAPDGEFKPTDLRFDVFSKNRLP